MTAPYNQEWSISLSVSNDDNENSFCKLAPSEGNFWLLYPGGKESFCIAGYLGSIPGLGRYPGKGMATHSSILALRIPWTETVGLQTMGSQRVGHDWATNTFFSFFLQGNLRKSIYLFGCAGSQLQHIRFSLQHATLSCDMETLSCNMWNLIPQPGIKPRSSALGA